MKKILLLIIALVGCGFAAQGITVSEDSLAINGWGDNEDVYFYSNARPSLQQRSDNNAAAVYAGTRRLPGKAYSGQTTIARIYSRIHCPRG